MPAREKKKKIEPTTILCVQTKERREGEKSIPAKMAIIRSDRKGPIKSRTGWRLLDRECLLSLFIL